MTDAQHTLQSSVITRDLQQFLLVCTHYTVSSAVHCSLELSLIKSEAHHAPFALLAWLQLVKSQGNRSRRNEAIIDCQVAYPFPPFLCY